jgi:Phosphoenolpyruvate synthase/pyruvate phosphate dikinase
VFRRLSENIASMENKQKNILWFKEVTKKDVELVGGKNGSLGEMFSQLKQKGVPVPNGFITTSTAFLALFEIQRD